MSWLRLTIETTADQVDSLTGLLEQFQAGSISLQPVSREELFAGQDVSGPVIWQQTSVTALLDADVDLDILLACIRNRIGTESILQYRFDLLHDQDWDQVYRDEVQPLFFSDRLAVIPGWAAAAEQGMASITLDPGLAFGTGRHPTTHMCLEWLAIHDLQGKTVVDYGCGSGILSLAAARLGADTVYAVDIDPQAVTATRQNADRNGLGDRIHVRDPGLDTELPQADLLLANILLNSLQELAPLFAARVKPGGEIILSGINSGQAQDCMDSYTEWFNMQADRHNNEWTMLYGTRNKKHTT